METIQKMLSLVFVLVAVGFFMITPSADAASKPMTLVVQVPYIDVHTGPGRGYPVFHALEQGESVRVLKQRTDWVKVKLSGPLPDSGSERQQYGWVSRWALSGSLDESGDIADFSPLGRDQVSGRRWYLASGFGRFGQSDSISLHAGYRLTANLAGELRVGRAIGEFSDADYVYLTINSTPFPEWRVSPFFLLGSGAVNAQPRTQLVQLEDSSDTSLLAGMGLTTYLARNFLLRLEYNQHLLLTNRQLNEDIRQWQLGFIVSF